MSKRLYLQSLLEKTLGSENVYFQPPESVKMQYPAIVYYRSGINNTPADDTVYRQTQSYTVTVIDRKSDSVVVDKVSLLPKTRWDRHYVSSNLHHDVFTITI